jgi:hypothetical protein
VLGIHRGRRVEQLGLRFLGKSVACWMGNSFNFVVGRHMHRNYCIKRVNN